MRVILLLCTSLLSFSRSLGGRNELIPLDRESWITNENLKTIIKQSFPYSICCNIYLSDLISNDDVIFNQFRSAYPYAYLLRRKTYECHGYFLLGPTDEEIVKAIQKVPSSISSTEILIIVNGHVDNNSSIFNTSLYGNSNLNIVSLSGMWSLSVNYLSPRKFEKHDRYEEMVHEYDVINFYGRELQACTFYRPPSTYLNRTINRTINGVESEVYLVETALERDGIEMQLFMIMAEKLNFTWVIKKPEGPYRYGRRVNNTKWVGGMIQMLRELKVDLAFANIWLTTDHNAFVNLTEPWYQLYIHFLVPRPRPISSFWGLIRPFSLSVWLLLIAAMLMHTLYTYTRAWIDPKFPKRYRNFVITLIDLIGCLLGMSTPKKDPNIKLQMLLWQTAGWIIITAYSSSLAARLASSDYEDRVDTVPQFLKSNLSWGRTGQTPPFHEYFDLTDPYASQLPSRYRHVNSDEESHEFIARGNYAIVGKVVDTCFFPEDAISTDDLKNYRLMRGPVGQFYVSFAVQPWLLTPINRMMLAMRDTGLNLYHLRDVIRRRDNFNLREVLVEHDGADGSARVLSLTPFTVGFALLLVGLLISTLVFYLELKHASGSSSIRELLRSIDKKRKIHDNMIRDELNFEKRQRRIDAMFKRTRCLKFG